LMKAAAEQRQLSANPASKAGWNRLFPDEIGNRPFGCRN